MTCNGKRYPSSSTSLEKKLDVEVYYKILSYYVLIWFKANYSQQNYDQIRSAFQSHSTEDIRSYVKSTFLISVGGESVRLNHTGFFFDQATIKTSKPNLNTLICSRISWLRFAKIFQIILMSELKIMEATFYFLKVAAILKVFFQPFISLHIYIYLYVTNYNYYCYNNNNNHIIHILLLTVC